ncbi:MAG: Ni/Fe-hydrogenase cytochrome b subunit, partial [Deltaproteobacteria bacterium]|nr:Ni/Fe-hydrogenase cytochrome b subunit [Deltaproteobacteria bacterium]
MDVLTPLTRIAVIVWGAYIGLKVWDMVARRTYLFLLDGTAQSNAFLVEMIVGVIIPWLMLLSPHGRR